MTDTMLRITARINGHVYMLHFPPDGYRLFCHQISQLKKDGCPLTWFDMVRLRRAGWELIKAHNKRRQC